MRALLALALLTLSACATLPPPPAHHVAYAWATFDADGIRDSGAAGLADRAANRPLTIDDPVRIASISKLVVALGVMRLVEQGVLDLDADVSTYLGWGHHNPTLPDSPISLRQFLSEELTPPLRNPAFPDRPITLRHLLSHTSSLRDGIDYAIPLGTDLRTALASPEAFDPEHPPGTFFRYANLGFPVIASIVERATGQRFDLAMAQLVLQPLGLDACFNWTTCSDAALARAVVLHEPDGTIIRDDLHGRRPACPVLAPEGMPCDLSAYRLGSNGALFSPQGGLRISVRDLAVIGRMVLNGGWHGGRRFVTYRSLREMFTSAWRFDGTNGDTDQGFYCAYGLAVQLLPVDQPGCRDDLFGNRRGMAGHAGDAYGLRSGLWIDSDSGEGIAFLSTGNGEDPPRGRTAYRAIEEWLAARLR